MIDYDLDWKIDWVYVYAPLKPCKNCGQSTEGKLKGNIPCCSEGCRKIISQQEIAQK